MANTPGKGSVLQLSIATVYTALAQLRRLASPTMKMGTVETTDIDSTWKTFIASVLEGGEVTAVLRYDPAQATHAALWTNFQAGTISSFKIILADPGAAVFGFDGIITAFTPQEATVDNIVELSITIQITGAVTITP